MLEHAGVVEVIGARCGVSSLGMSTDWKTSSLSGITSSQGT